MLVSTVGKLIHQLSHLDPMKYVIQFVHENGLQLLILSRFSATIMLLHVAILNRIQFPANKDRSITMQKPKLHTNIVPLHLQFPKVVRESLCKEGRHYLCTKRIT